MWRVVGLPSLSSTCSMAVHPRIFGRLRKAQCTPSTKVKEANKGMH